MAAVDAPPVFVPRVGARRLLADREAVKTPTVSLLPLPTVLP